MSMESSYPHTSVSGSFLSLLQSEGFRLDSPLNGYVQLIFYSQYNCAIGLHSMNGYTGYVLTYERTPPLDYLG